MTTLETAEKAAITDKKRFYRWASKGIARATHEHQRDLERLRILFGLPSIGAFWDQGKILSLNERIEEAGKVDWIYEYAFKLLVSLKSQGKSESKYLLDWLDAFFLRHTEAKNMSPAEVLHPRTGDELLSYIQINSPAAYNFLMSGGHREAVLERLEQLLLGQKNDKHNTLIANLLIIHILGQTEASSLGES